MSAIRKLLFGTKTNKKILNLITRSSSNFVIKSDLPDVDIPECPVDELIFSKADQWPDRIAAECGITGRKYTYQDLRNKTTNLGRNLRKKLKLQKGDVLAILLPNCPEFALIALGASKAGLTITTLNPIYTPDEIARQLSDSSAKVIVTAASLSQLAQKASQNIPILTLKSEQSASTPQGCVNFEEFTEPVDFPDLPPISNNEVTFLPYSSGTTGLPKGVELTHRNIVANLLQYSAEQLNVVKWTTKDHQDIVPVVLPQFHIYGLVVNTLNTLLKGAKCVTLPKFTPELYIQTLRKHRPTLLFVAPPLGRILD